MSRFDQCGITDGGQQFGAEAKSRTRHAGDHLGEWMAAKSVLDVGVGGLDAVIALASIHGRGMLLRVGLGCLAEALALSGQLDAAEHALRELDALGMPHVRFREADIIRARAWTAVAGGDVVGARELLEDSYVLAVETENLVAAFTAVHDLVRLGQPEYAHTCCELADRIEGPRAQAHSAHAVALAARDAHSLLGASHDLAAIGASLLAAEAAFDAAAAIKRAGNIRAATAAVRRAEELAAMCEGARRQRTVRPRRRAGRGRHRLVTSQGCAFDGTQVRSAGRGAPCGALGLGRRGGR